MASLVPGKALPTLERSLQELPRTHSARISFTVKPDRRCGIFRRSKALQLISRPPAIRALLVEDALGYDALVDDKRAGGIARQLSALSDAEFSFVFVAHQLTR